MTSLTRRALAILPIAALLTAGVAAQGDYDQDKMKANFAAMQEHDWFKGAGWITDFDAAKKQAAESGKPIFAYFTRTYSP